MLEYHLKSISGFEWDIRAQFMQTAEAISGDSISCTVPLSGVKLS